MVRNSDILQVKEDLCAKYFFGKKENWVPERNMNRSLRWRDSGGFCRARFVRKDFKCPGRNLVGIAVGNKISDGELQEENCISFFVTRKYAKSGISKSNLLPKEVEGIPTDVIEAGIPRCVNGLGNQNGGEGEGVFGPGDTVGILAHEEHYSVGSLGAIVVSGGHTYILSNNHVIADEGHAPLGTIVEGKDRGSAGIRPIARLSRFTPFAHGFPGSRLDAAIAKIDSGVSFSNEIPGFGNLRQIGQARQNRRVKILGAASGDRTGQISNLSGTFSIRYHHSQYVVFSNLIVILPIGRGFAQKGDSGSVIVDEQDGVGVGLLLGTLANGMGLANHLTEVMSALDVELP